MNQVGPDPDADPNQEQGIPYHLDFHQIPGCPPCLVPLATIDFLSVLADGANIGRRKSFKIHDSDDCMIYEGVKDLGKGCFDLILRDINGQESIRVERGHKTCGGCSVIASCQGPEVSIDAPTASSAGQLSENFSMVGSSFKLECSNGLILQIATEASEDMAPFIIRQDDKRVGAIRRVDTRGVLNRILNANSIEVNFTMDLSPKVKACIIGTAFYLSDRFYETNSSFTRHVRNEEEY